MGDRDYYSDVIFNWTEAADSAAIKKKNGYLVILLLGF